MRHTALRGLAGPAQLPNPRQLLCAFIDFSLAQTTEGFTTGENGET